MPIKQVSGYEASDGSIFSDRKDAVRHELEVLVDVSTGERGAAMATHLISKLVHDPTFRRAFLNILGELI